MNKILSLLGAGPNDTFFSTSGRAEANFQVLLSTYIDYVRESGRTHFLAPVGEHCSIVQGIKRLEKLDLIGKSVPLNANGQVTREALEEQLRPRSAMLSISWANEWTGVIQPISDLASLCQEKGVRLHVDATSVLGKLYFQFADLGVDFLTFNDGVIARKEMSLSPLYFDDRPRQLSDLQSLEQALGRIDQLCLETARLRTLFEEELCLLIPSCQILFKNADRLPDCTAFAIPGMHGEMLVEHLRKRKISATTGEGRLAPLLLACGIDPLVAHSAISLSFSHEINEEQIRNLLKILTEIISKAPSPSTEEAAQKGMRLATAKGGSIAEGRALTCHLLVDESDGIIADCKWELFGPSSMNSAAEATTKLLIRKSYVQAKHLTADRIEKTMGRSSEYVNLILDAVDEAASQCMDIPIDEQLIAPQAMESALGEASEYPHWLQLSKEEQKDIIEEVIARDIRPYIELDAGGVEVLQVEHPHIRIAYKGACTSCYSATGTTLDAIQNILRSKINSSLVVVPEM